MVVIGGGAAGFMSAITAAENGVKEILIIERSSKTLEKVRISGGGRCNITNASWIPTELIDNYPRGGLKLLESFSRFATGDVYEWFEDRGLKLKIESDNRVFPASDSSTDVISCLKNQANNFGIKIITKTFVKRICKNSANLFEALTDKKEAILSKKVLISTGGHPSGYKLAELLGHKIIKPVPSLFTFTSKENNLKECSGVSISNVNLKIILTKNTYEINGDLLITHWGFSGPAILKLSSIAARELFLDRYNFELHINWSDLDYEELSNKIDFLRFKYGKSNIYNSRPISRLTKRLWLFLLNKIEIDKDKKWAEILSSEREKIINLLLKDVYIISSKGPFGEEFVTSGGVFTEEVNFKTMESVKCSGLYFSGEVLNVDGITGGFNFQHCWTSGWLAGNAIAIQSL